MAETMRTLRADGGTATRLLRRGKGWAWQTPRGRTLPDQITADLIADGWLAENAPAGLLTIAAWPAFADRDPAELVAAIEHVRRLIDRDTAAMDAAFFGTT